MSQADEEIYHNRLNLINRLKKHLTQLDEESGETGKLTRENLSTALTECFRLKDGELIVALVKAAQTELNMKEEEDISYKNLFEEVCHFLHTPHAKWNVQSWQIFCNLMITAYDNNLWDFDGSVLCIIVIIIAMYSSCKRHVNITFSHVKPGLDVCPRVDNQPLVTLDMS